MAQLHDAASAGGWKHLRAGDGRPDSRPHPPRGSERAIAMQLFVVVDGRSRTREAVLAAALAAARRDGWEVVHGWVAPLARERVVCTGRIGSADDARRALLAAVAGAGLIVRCTVGPDVADRFLDDLRRLGPVTHINNEQGRRGSLTDRQRAILGLLAEGLTVREAAAALGIARSSADRRLAASRRALGVPTTAAAIAAVLAGRR